jgi:hypothetical protein
VIDVPRDIAFSSGRRAILVVAVIVGFVAILTSSGSFAGAAQASGKTETISSGAGPNGPSSISAGDFVIHVDNPYFPLRPGTTYRYKGTKDGKPTIDIFRISRGRRRILGVPCAIVKDRLFEAGKLAERTTDWYAQDRQGRVWYFGESTAELNAAGKVASTEGSWQTGIRGAKPGIFMPATPRPGQSFRQEFFKGQAEDHFRVIGLHAPISVPSGFYPHALLTREWTPLEPGVIDRKYYVRGVGEVSEETAKGPLEISRLVSVSRSSSRWMADSTAP